MELSYNNVTYRFPDEALTGTDAPVTEAVVLRPADPAATDSAGITSAAEPAKALPAELHYHIYAQRRQGSRYLAAHGCSLCALASLIGAVPAPDAPAFASNAEAAEILVSLEAARNALLGDRRRQLPGLWPSKLAGPQTLKLPGPLARSARMPLNIAGVYRILQLFMDAEYLDSEAEKDPDVYYRPRQPGHSCSGHRQIHPFPQRRAPLPPQRPHVPDHRHEGFLYPDRC